MAWEITAGKSDLDWKTSKHWWVMTWIHNGDKKQSDFSPKHVFHLDGGALMMPYAPNHAVVFGNPKETAGPAGGRMFYLLEKNIWARMPLVLPSVPNVDMFFLESPFYHES